jgi:type 1 glutamine amidotransferase
VNHVLSGPRTILLGLRYEHKESGKLYTQDIAGWQKPLGKGQVFYFMPGHKPADFDNPTYAQILTNAVTSR